MTSSTLLARLIVGSLVIAIAAAGARAAAMPVTWGVVAGVGLMSLALVAESRAGRAPLDRLIWGVVGGVVGFAGGAILGVTGGRWGLALGAVLGLYLGAAIGVRRGPELTGVNARLFARTGPVGAATLVDTSAIIDGRIADLAATGFIEGPLVVPQFVLREVQQIADSTDPRKRSRGKRGFDVIQRLQERLGPSMTIEATDVPGVTDVDTKLLEIAKTRSAKILTTDYNLNRLAELRGVGVLNVNDLANALKPAVVAGDPLHVDVRREGKESGQGVAYLDDGTMVVIEQGKRWIGQGVDVIVTSVLQTPSGRIIFTRLRDEEALRA